MNTTPEHPYFGSFDPRKHYMRVLFRPEKAVQARELNDLQATLQHQIGVHADHIFKAGAKVSNARQSVVDVQYVRLQDLDPDGNPVQPAVWLEGYAVRGEASGVTAVVTTATDAIGDDPPTLYVQYQGTGIDGVQSKFVPGEPLTITSPMGVVTRAVVKCPACPGALVNEIWPTGKAIFFYIDEGIFYWASSFVSTDRQSKILSKYAVPDEGDGVVGRTGLRGLKVGLEYVETYVSAEDDNELYDNALGYPAQGNDGAHRLMAELILSVRSLEDAGEENFITLARIDYEGRTVFVKSDQEYSAIMDAMAKRTFETNGNYTVRPFKTSFLNHKRTTPRDPLGWSVNGDEDNLVAVVKPSVGYVLGYRVETTVDTPVLFPKARETKRVPGAIMPFTERSYIVLKPGNTVWPNRIDQVGLTGEEKIVLYDGLNQGGDAIGTLRVYNAVLHEGTPGAPGATYRYYFNSLVLAPGKVMDDVQSVGLVSTGFAAEAVREDGRFDVKNPGKTSLVYKLPYSDVKSLKSTNAASPGTMILTARRKFRATLNAAGEAVITATTNQSFTGSAVTTIAAITTPAHVTTPLDPSTLTFSATSLRISAGSDKAGDTVTVITDVLMTNQTQNQKTLEVHSYTTDSTPPTAANSVVKLGVADVQGIVSAEVYDYTDPVSPVFIKDVTQDWRLNSALTDYEYGEASVVRASTDPDAPANSHRLRITYKAWVRSGTAGFFTVDSYAQPLASGDVTYEGLPVFAGQDGQRIRLSDALDFRPDTSPGAGAAVEVIPSNSSTAIFEVEYYQARVDLLCLRSDGTLFVKPGKPSDSPVAPKVDEDAMALYEIWLRPYTYSLLDVSTKFIENKRYTMRDIGRLESRIGKLEYYSTLSLLESTVTGLQTKDVNGFDRYKNGFLVDDFSGFKASDLNHPEFRAAVDSRRYELRPSFRARNNLLVADTAASRGVKFLGGVAIRDYTPEVVEEQPYATKHISVNPYFQFSKRGQMILEPNTDTWSDDTILPQVTTEVDTGVEALRGVAEAADILGTTWGAWAEVNRTVIGVDTTATLLGMDTWVETGSDGLTTRTTTRTTTSSSQTTTTEVNLARQGVDRSIGSRVQTYSSGLTVRDVTITPYIRTRDVRFTATGMKANTRVYAFFDGVAVSEHCRVIDVVAADSGAPGTEFLERGSPLYTNANGEIFGVFTIPAGQFFTGQKSFRLTTDVDYENSRETGVDPDSEYTYASALYFAGGVDTVKQESVLNLITPVFTELEVSEATTRIDTVSTESRDSVESTLRLVTPWTGSGGGDPARFGIFDDPVAQSFTRPEDEMVTGLDLYFQAVDAVNDSLWVELRTMINGYPSSQVLSHLDVKTSDITVSDDGQAVTHIEFKYPVFVRGGDEYCFVVGGYSPDTRIWVAKMGGKDVKTGTVVETQPVIGSSFRSQNGTTWNAEQMEDIKYRLYTARFTGDAMTVVLKNTKQAYEGLPENPIETQAGSTRVRVFHDSHGFVEGDRLQLELLVATSFELEVATGSTPPHPGQALYTPTSRSLIKTVTPLPTLGRFEVTVEKLVGRLDAGQTWTTGSLEPFVITYLLEETGVSYANPPIISPGNGTVVQGSHEVYPGNQISGIPVDSVQKVHTVVAVDSLHSYIIDTGVPAGFTGRAGGTQCAVADPCIRYDVFNISGSSLAHSSSEYWEVTGLGHGRPGSLFESDDYREAKPVAFSLGADVSLEQPQKLSNPYGEQVRGVTSMKVTGHFSNFPSDKVSPVINTESFSAILISNNIDDDDQDEKNVLPNASNRWVEETHFVNGTAPYKYVSVTAILENPASDLRVLVDAYRDVYADFDIYVKAKSTSEPLDIDYIPWVKLELPAHVASADLQDFTEYDALTSTSLPGWTGEPFTAYKIKIVGRSRNPCKPPLFKALRCIAIT